MLGYPELSKTYTISEEGMLIVGLGQPIQGVGRSSAEVREALEGELSHYLQRPRVSLFLAKAGERRVSVIGDLSHAGQVPLTGQGTLLETLTQAGWKYDPFSGHQATIIRQGRTLTVEVGLIIRSKAPALNIRLKPDDIVILGSPDPVMVIGEVRKPDRFSVGERGGITLRELLARAQGITEAADLPGSKIIRRDGSEEEIDLNTYLFRGGLEEEVVLKGGDTLYIPQGGQIGVFVLGMVIRPGYFRQPKGITVLQALALADDPQFGAKLSHSKLVRGYSSGQPEVVTVNVDRLVHKGDMTQNLAMQDGDVLFIPETATSDVLDFVSRMLSPLNLGISTGAAAAAAMATK